MPSARFALALERLSSGDWLDFERFAAAFLAPEYPSLRTTASPSGDRGRDGQMYSVEEEPHTVVQYSVAQDWASKIRATIKRLAETIPSTRTLIYATNQIIGPAADDLVSEVRRQHSIALDIRDRNWFVEREDTYPQRSIAADDLATRYVNPLLVERGVRSFAARALDDSQARVALVHLALETEDKASGKGWTRSCFEALVLSALNDTSDVNRMSRHQVIESVTQLLPAADGVQVTQQVEGALNRLSRRGGPVKHRVRDDSFSLSFDEQQELRDRLAQFALQEECLKEQLVSVLRIADPKLHLTEEQWNSVANDLMFGLETVLLRRGEEFALSVTTGEIKQVTAQEVLNVVTAAGRSSGALVSDEAATAAIIEILERPSDEMRAHLRRLADAYTMYAFLRQTPDVQKAVLSIFSGGELWLDTNALLPLLAETLMDRPEDRHYTTIFRAALHGGLKLYVTEGVIEELDGHLNLCLAFARTESGAWRSRVPFLYAAYALSGRARGEFAGWLENFRGRDHPMDDLREYLAEVHAIDRRDLREEAETAPIELRAAVQEVWYAVHERRRNRPDNEISPSVMTRLVAHDVENTVGVIQLRRATSMSPLGYHQWFLTLDKTALSLKRRLSERLGGEVPSSPALSPDFMAQYLRLGSVRTAIERELWATLPVLTDISRYEFVPKGLIDSADTIRAEISGLDERVIRRRVRDQLGRLKLEQGPEALAGIRGMEELVMERIAASQDTG
jgi:hypothetical protein